MTGDDSEPLIDRGTLAFVLPLAVFLVLSSFNPDFSQYAEGSGEPNAELSTDIRMYCGLVAAQVVLAVGLLIWFGRVYRQDFPWRWSWMAIPTGVIGVVLWIALTHFQWEDRLAGAFGLDFGRPGFDPGLIEQPALRTSFFVLRFTLLAVLVPIVEELFLRGWLLRWIENPDFRTVQLNQLGPLALVAASGYGALTHPTEAVAAIVWFGLVTGLMRWTGNLWDCVIAHAVTNLLLGIYVVSWQQWQLW